MKEVAAQIIGPDQITQIVLMMVGEDMAEVLDRAPGCFIMIGALDSVSRDARSTSQSQI